MAGETHIVKAYTEEISQLTGLIAEMGGYAQTAVADSVQALKRRDSALANKVIDSDRKIDALETQVSAFVVRLLALRQPMAVDLRTVVAGLKIASDLERIGDYAKNIAKRSLVLNDNPVAGPVVGIVNLSRMVEMMLHEVLDAYVNSNAEVATQLRSRDEEVDAAHTGIFREILTYMIEDPRMITSCTHLVFIAKNLERIGDHSTNIAESIIFQVNGERPIERHLTPQSSQTPSNP
ncbi:MAG TPA: phosphate signaling complex protein PhoU [Alphaproteobacteria bacterium]|nr:phosphate signaling complex protein PhoU [Alphaproteobacteria bacterium]